VRARRFSRIVTVLGVAKVSDFDFKRRCRYLLCHG